MNKHDWDVRYKLLKKNKNVGSMSWDINDKVLEFQKSIRPLFHMKHKTVVDFGCGTCKNTQFLIETFHARNYIGYDIVELVVNEMKKFGFDIRVFDNKIEKADCIWASSVLQHMDPGTYLDTLLMFKKALNKNGRIYIIESAVYYSHADHCGIFKGLGLKHELLMRPIIDGILIYEVWK